ncbi:hypothetical protein BSKO_09582 [Bryopsis sp. KO-2023]|nr:hypothetical protein BSKO_09582 [Bryopsis sp. KO-2023]
MMKAAIAVLVVFGFLSAAEADWREGRATFYGDQPWLWDINKGSCGYGQLDPNKGTGWDIAAMPDGHYEYSGSCGRCYEVKCKPSTFRDNYGNTLDRNGACRDANKVLKVTITDTCPCHYETNFYSNKRWCCMDMEHLDISVFAYDKLADRRWGVIGLQYRPVPCGPEGPAGSYAPGTAPPVTPAVQPPPAALASSSRMSWLRKAISEGNVQAFDGTGK